MLITYVLLYHDFQERKSIEGSVFSACNLCVFIPRFLGKKSVEGLIFISSFCTMKVLLSDFTRRKPPQFIHIGC